MVRKVLNNIGCHIRGTGILTVKKTIVAVENVSVGDKLIGPDGNARNVRRLIHGVGDLFEITSLVDNTGFVVNFDHKLSLKVDHGKVNYPQDVSVREFITWSHDQRSYYRLWRPNFAPKFMWKMSEFSIQYWGYDEYFGFTLDGDQRYLTENYIVHHNCS